MRVALFWGGWFGASMRFLQERGLLAYGYSARGQAWAEPGWRGVEKGAPPPGAEVPIFWGFVPYTPIPVR